jgi:hypothetical protein
MWLARELVVPPSDLRSVCLEPCACLDVQAHSRHYLVGADRAALPGDGFRAVCVCPVLARAFRSGPVRSCPPELGKRRPHQKALRFLEAPQSIRFAHPCSRRWIPHPRGRHDTLLRRTVTTPAPVLGQATARSGSELVVRIETVSSRGSRAAVLEIASRSS